MAGNSLTPNNGGPGDMDPFSGTGRIAGVPVDRLPDGLHGLPADEAQGLGVTSLSGALEDGIPGVGKIAHVETWAAPADAPRMGVGMDAASGVSTVPEAPDIRGRGIPEPGPVPSSADLMRRGYGNPTEQTGTVAPSGRRIPPRPSGRRSRLGLRSDQPQGSEAVSTDARAGLLSKMRSQVGLGLSYVRSGEAPTVSDDPIEPTVPDDGKPETSRLGGQTIREWPHFRNQIIEEGRKLARIHNNPVADATRHSSPLIELTVDGVVAIASRTQFTDRVAGLSQEPFVKDSKQHKRDGIFERRCREVLESLPGLRATEDKDVVDKLLGSGTRRETLQGLATVAKLQKGEDYVLVEITEGGDDFELYLTETGLEKVEGAAPRGGRINLGDLSASRAQAELELQKLQAAARGDHVPADAATDAPSSPTDVASIFTDNPVLEAWHESSLNGAYFIYGDAMGLGKTDKAYSGSYVVESTQAGFASVGMGGQRYLWRTEVRHAAPELTGVVVRSLQEGLGDMYRQTGLEYTSPRDQLAYLSLASRVAKIGGMAHAAQVRSLGMREQATRMEQLAASASQMSEIAGRILVGVARGEDPRALEQQLQPVNRAPALPTGEQLGLPSGVTGLPEASSFRTTDLTPSDAVSFS